MCEVSLNLSSRFFRPRPLMCSKLRAHGGGHNEDSDERFCGCFGGIHSVLAEEKNGLL